MVVGGGGNGWVTRLEFRRFRQQSGRVEQGRNKAQ